MKTILNIFRMFFVPILNVFADVVNTAVVDGEGVVTSKLDNATRIVYSKEIIFKAMPNLRFFQFAAIKTELGVTPGLTISMMTYDNIALGGTLTEGVAIVGKALSSSMKSITVAEKGNSIKVSELLLQSSFDDIMATSTTLLARDYASVLDLELRNKALGNTTRIFGRKTTAVKIDSRVNITDENPLTVATIKDAVEILATNNAPKFEGSYYICFIHPHQSRDLRDDAAWINASNYGSPQNLFTGEIGKIDDVRFIETTFMCNGAVGVDDPAYVAGLVKGAVGGSASNAIYQSVIFGENYYGIAFALPMELRDEPPKDFGREHGIAWYAIWGVDLLQEDNGVVIETA